jgi:hypothetical protein
MLIEISRILGITNRYLAAGGVKGDSHFPWHAQSNLSKIRHDLDTWASGAQDAFLSIEALFGQTESQTLVLSSLEPDSINLGRLKQQTSVSCMRMLSQN